MRLVTYALDGVDHAAVLTSRESCRFSAWRRNCRTAWPA